VVVLGVSDSRSPGAALVIDGQLVAGAAIDRDTVSASLKAVISALNRGVMMGGATEARQVA